MTLLTDLKIILPTKKNGVYKAGIITCESQQLSAFALASTLMQPSNNNGISKTDLDTHPTFFAFDVHSILDTALTDERFIISRESYNREIVQLKASSNRQLKHHP
jgi:hypothetical protein